MPPEPVPFENASRRLDSGPSAAAPKAGACLLAFVAPLLTLLWGTGPAAAQGGNIKASGSLIAGAPEGTAPLEVVSTTAVANLNADMLDGLDAADLLRKTENVVVVAASGGDFTSIQGAIDSIQDEGLSNQYTVYVAPGSYYGSITMRPFINIVGAGPSLTRVVGAGGSTLATAATVTGADSALLRDLTIRSSAVSTEYAVGVRLDGTKPTIRRISVDAAGGSVANIALYSKSVSLLEIRDSEFLASTASQTNTGILNDDATLLLYRSTVTAAGATTNYAIDNQASSGSYQLLVYDSELDGADDAVNGDTGYVVRVEHSRLGSTVTANGGTAICALNVDFAATAYTNTCP